MAKDNCIKIGGQLGDLATKMGGKVMKNEDGMIVVQEVGGKEAVFPDEKSAFNFIARTIRIAANNAEIHAKINEIIDSKGELAIDNLTDLVKFHDDLSRSATLLHGGEQPGNMQGALGGQTGLYLTRQQSWMMRQGEGGRYIGNAMHRYNVANEHMEMLGESKLRPAAKLLKTITTPAELKNHTAPPEAQELWDKVIKPHIDEVKDMADFLGVEDDLIPGDGVPTWYGVTENDMDHKVVNEARKQGIIGNNEGAKELAQRFNDADFGLRPRTMSQRDWIKAKKWLASKGTSYAGDANHMRADAGYMNDIEATLTGWNRAVSRRLSEAAVFGPNLERLHQALDIMAEENGGKHIQLAERVARDMLGKIHMPRTEAERTMTDIARFSLASSMSRHISQNKIAIMQHGFVGEAMALGKEVLQPWHWIDDVNELNKYGVFARQTSYDIGEHPSDLFLDRSEDEVKNVRGWLQKSGIKPAAHMTAKATTLGIHAMINFDRMLAGTAAKNLFDNYLTRALKGDRNKLALFADMLGMGDPTTAASRDEFINHLSGMDRTQLKKFFVKRMADTAGTTYYPSDMPGMARQLGPLGKWLTMFRGFRWNVAHNIWNQMFSPNYSKAYRLRVFGRFLGATGLLSPIDAVMRHAKVAGAVGVGAAALGIGISNIDSEVAYNAYEKALKDPSTASIIYAQFMLAVSDGSLGITSDMMQGFNLANPDIFGRSIISGNIPILANIDNLAMAGALAAHGALSDDEHAKDRAYKEFLEDLPLGDALARAAGVRKPPKVPKTQIVREMLKKGANALDLP